VVEHPLGKGEVESSIPSSSIVLSSTYRVYSCKADFVSGASGYGNCGGIGIVSAPNQAGYRVSPGRRIHILTGDLTGGGHKFGAGKGKSEFPQSWSDDAIIDAIEDVANDPTATGSPTGYRRTKVTGTRNSVAIVVIVDHPTGAIITG
jgi:Bacterial EndoU nuclease